MTDSAATVLVAIPLGLGLIGFVEPCSIGSTVVFLKYLEGRPAARKLAETILFTVTRAAFIGGLGVLAALVGTLFLDLQRGAWVALGALYLALGLVLILRRGRVLMVALGPSLKRLSGIGGSFGLGLLFGLNIPACAMPLLAALLVGAAGAGPVEGFVMLAVFGIGLSLPILAVVAVPSARGLIDRSAALSGRFPVIAGSVLVAVGAWSIGFGLFATLDLTAATAT